MRQVQKQRQRPRRPGEPYEQEWPLAALLTAVLDVDLDALDKLLDEP